MTELSREEAGDMRTADEAIAELNRRIAEDHKSGYGVHKTSDKANHRYRDGFVAGYEAGAKSAQSDGWRQCAKGQRTTQFCGQLENAVAAERAVSDRLLKDLEHLSLYVAFNGDTWVKRTALKCIEEVEAMRKRSQQAAPEEKPE